MIVEDPIRLTQFRLQSTGPASETVDHQFRLSFGLVAVLLAATVAAAATGMM